MINDKVEENNMMMIMITNLSNDQRYSIESNRCRRIFNDSQDQEEYDDVIHCVSSHYENGKNSSQKTIRIKNAKISRTMVEVSVD